MCAEMGDASMEAVRTEGLSEHLRLELDPDYTVAMVGTPDRRYLWILSRTPQLEEALYQKLVANAQQLGFPISDLIKATPPLAR